VKGETNEEGIIYWIEKRKKTLWTENSQDIESKGVGEVCDMHRENEATSAEWYKHIND